MTIGNFIYHLKHKSTGITIKEYNCNNMKMETIFKGCVSSFENWKDKCLFNKMQINRIIPSDTKDELTLIYMVRL